MSLKIVVPGFTYTGPKILTDQIEVAGSLMLIEPGSPAGAWPAGVPSNGAEVPNLLAERAAALGITASPTFSFAGLSGAAGLMERTGRGALHGIVSQAALTTGKGAQIILPDDLITYMLAHPTNQIYYSAWQRVTRIGADAQPARLLIGANDNSKMHTYWYKTGLRPPATAARVGVYNEASATAVGAFMQAITSQAWASAAPATVAEIDRSWQWGAVGRINIVAGYFDSMPSYALYRFYMEDLTVSGRSHASVLAQDQALYAAAFAEGGRYHGDTYTDPATLP